MKKFFYLSFLLCSVLYAEVGPSVDMTVESSKESTIETPARVEVTRGDVKIIEATENIRYLSQKIAKEYLYIYNYPQNEEMKKRLYRTLGKLGENLKEISAATTDEDTNNVLDFLAYSQEQILNILGKKPSKEMLVSLLDYADTLQEGAESIGKTYAYNFTREEEMLVASKNVSFLLERIIKYYMAIYSGYDSKNNRMKLHASVNELASYMQKLNGYDYPEEIQNIRKKINMVWKRDKSVIGEMNRYFVPSLLFDSVVYLEEEVDMLALYHSQRL